MKRIIVLIIVLCLFRNISACDICGCNSGNYFIGPLPQFNNHFVGLEYSFQNYHTVLNSDNNQYSKDFYQTAELLGGTRIGERWQMLMFIPYNINKTNSDDGAKHNSGFGDITWMGNFDLLNKKYINADTQTVMQQLWIGVGIKLPTGKFNIDTGEVIASASMQPGTGSYDYLVNTLYTYQIRSWGLNVNINYKINQKAHDFKFGNRLTVSSFVFRNFHIKKITASPNVGLFYESSAANMNKSERVIDTGGNVLIPSIGTEIRIANVSVGGNVEIPIWSDLSNGQTQAKIRGMVHLSILF